MRLEKELARGAPKLVTARSWLARRALVQGAPRRLGARCVGHASTRSVLRSWLRAQHGLRNLVSHHARPKVLSRALVSHAARVLRTTVQSAQCGPPLAPTCATTLMRRAPTRACQFQSHAVQPRDPFRILRALGRASEAESQALRSCMHARKYVCNYVIGRPTKAQLFCN